jgi:NAD(P)-dependent dehydrogenase (short-subunit alcohol dehydrogenase family)
MDRNTILITGASSGFGRDTAETLARAGHRVFASCHWVPVCPIRRTTRRRPLRQHREGGYAEARGVEIVDYH